MGEAEVHLCAKPVRRPFRWNLGYFIQHGRWPDNRRYKLSKDFYEGRARFSPDEFERKMAYELRIDWDE